MELSGHDDETVGHWWHDPYGCWAMVGSILYGPRAQPDQIAAAIVWGEGH